MTQKVIMCCECRQETLFLTKSPWRLLGAFDSARFKPDDVPRTAAPSPGAIENVYDRVITE